MVTYCCFLSFWELAREPLRSAFISCFRTPLRVHVDIGKCLSPSVKLLSHVWLFVTLWTVAHQAPPSMGFSRQEYWSGLPLPSPEDFPHPGIEPRSPSLQADALTSQPPGKPSKCLNNALIPNHFTAVCLPKDICSIFLNEKVLARFNLFLAHISPPTVLAHPNWPGLVAELHSHSQKHSAPQYAQLWQEASRHLKSTAIRIWQHFLNFALQTRVKLTSLALEAPKVLGVYTVTK